MFGDARTGDGFWYSHEIGETAGLTEEQLYWVPHPNGLCILWHVGHSANRERVHIGQFLQGRETTLIPPGYDVFGTEWCSVTTIRRSIGSIDDVVSWAQEVREESREYIRSLTDDEVCTVPTTSERGLTIGHWLFITAAHTALHVGRIQLLRACIEDRHEEPCW
jgi:hypothetical protein